MHSVYSLFLFISAFVLVYCIFLYVCIFDATILMNNDVYKYGLTFTFYVCGT